jgi:tetratricopeptide (TPR) repeat protein
MTGNLIQDIDYTLRAFPNHHRALNAVARYALRGGKQWANKRVTSADCYFQRALKFVPGDQTVYVLYGNYLAQLKDANGAIAQYKQALQLAPDSIELHYNTGLLYLKLGDIATARHHADIAYAGGHPLSGLRDRIAAEESRQAAAMSVKAGTASAGK